jgi:hypothetical protein
MDSNFSAPDSINDIVKVANLNPEIPEEWWGARYSGKFGIIIDLRIFNQTSSFPVFVGALVMFAATMSQDGYPLESGKTQRFPLSQLTIVKRAKDRKL